MPSTAAAPFGRLRHLGRLHARLWIASATSIGVALALILMSPLSATTSILVGWDTGAVVYLVAATTTAARFDLKRVRSRAAEEDEGAVLLLILTVAAAVASLAAIIVELAPAPGYKPGSFELALAIVTIVLSWTLIHAIFAFHYAHEFYGDGLDRRAGGLVFPDDERPDYWDFAYFAFVVGMTFQVSDVQVTSKLIRRLVVAHGVVSFVFNVAILALVVNIAGSVLDK